MKQQQLMLGLMAFVLIFVEYRLPSTQAQTIESSTAGEVCPIEDNIRSKVKFSPDGQFLAANWPEKSLEKGITATVAPAATAIDEDTYIADWGEQPVRIWNVRTGALVTTLIDERLTYLEKFAFSSNNKHIVTSGYYSGVPVGRLSDVMLWDIRTSQKIRTFKSEKNNGEIKTLSFSPDGQFILATYVETGHSIWNVASGAEETYLAERGSEYSEFSPDGKLVLTAGLVIKLWDRQSGKLLHTFNRSQLSLKHGIFSPDGNYILVPVDDEMILADSQTYQKVHSFDNVWSDWQFSPDGKYILAVTKEGQSEKIAVVLWDVETGKLVQEFPSDSRPWFNMVVSFLNNESILFIKRAVYDPQPQTVFAILDIETGRELEQLTVDIDQRFMQSYAITSDGKYLAIGTEDPTTITLWDIETGKQIQLKC